MEVGCERSTRHFPMSVAELSRAATATTPETFPPLSQNVDQRAKSRIRHRSHDQQTRRRRQAPASSKQKSPPRNRRASKRECNPNEGAIPNEPHSEQERE